MAGLESGRLDRRIVIERAGVVDDGYQERESGWTAVATVAAEYRPGRGSERFAAAAQSASQPVAFWIRWSRLTASITPRDRVRFDGHVYSIVGVAEIGRREGVELMCVTSDDGSAGAADA